MCFGSAESQFMSVYSSLYSLLTARESVSVCFISWLIGCSGEPWHLPIAQNTKLLLLGGNKIKKA